MGFIGRTTLSARQVGGDLTGLLPLPTTAPGVVTLAKRARPELELGDTPPAGGASSYAVRNYLPICNDPYGPFGVPGDNTKWRIPLTAFYFISVNVGCAPLPGVTHGNGAIAMWLEHGSGVDSAHMMRTMAPGLGPILNFSFGPDRMNVGDIIRVPLYHFTGASSMTFYLKHARIIQIASAY